MRLLLIDNHDSYTWNLAHRIAGLTGALPHVVRNDAVDLDDIRRFDPDAVILSPGPGRPGMPRDLGVCDDVLRHLDRPLLGVCLGHQALAWSLGGRILQAPEPVHGRRSALTHDGQGLFRGLPQGLPVVRYHSLIVDQPLPDGLIATCFADDGVLMGVREVGRPRFGLQFHPESIGTPHGSALLQAFLDIARRERGVSVAPVAAPPVAPAPASPSGDTQLLVRRLDVPTDAEAVYTRLLHGRPGAFWLDSAGRQGASPSRFSYLGAADGPLGRLLTWRQGRPVQVQGVNGTADAYPTDLLDALRAPLTAHHVVSDVPFPFTGGWVGWFGYGCKALWGFGPSPEAAAPDAAFAFCDRLIVIDHDEGRTWLVALTLPGQADAARTWFNTTTSALSGLTAPPRSDARPVPRLQPAVPHGDYLQAVHRSQEQIRAGESYEICLTQRLHTAPLARPLDTYRRLRRLNPAPYGAFLQLAGTSVLCSSPEQFLKVDADGTVSARPIKGTAARHPDPEQDQQAATDLQHDPKERAENLMIVDLLRHDLGRVCQPATVEVPSLMAVERFATVHHLVSTITGQLRPDCDALHAVAAAFPPGSMTGAPKERTVEILDALEPDARGIYSGALGWLGVSGAADLAVVIRTAVVTEQGTEVGVGGAITVLSDAEREWSEALLKARALDAALTEPEDAHGAASTLRDGL